MKINSDQFLDSPVTSITVDESTIVNDFKLSISLLMRCNCIRFWWEMGVSSLFTAQEWITKNTSRIEHEIDEQWYYLIAKRKKKCVKTETHDSVVHNSSNRNKSNSIYFENFSLKVVWIDMSASVIEIPARFNDIIW